MHFQVNPPCKLQCQPSASFPPSQRCPGRCSEHVFFKAPWRKGCGGFSRKKYAVEIFFFHKSILMEQSRKAVSNLGMLLILLLFSSKLMTFKISIHWRRQVGICATVEFCSAVLRILWKREDNGTTKMQKQPLGHNGWNKPACSQHHLSPEAQGIGSAPFLQTHFSQRRTQKEPAQGPISTPSASTLLLSICICLTWIPSTPAVLPIPLDPEEMVQSEQKEVERYRSKCCWSS